MKKYEIFLYYFDEMIGGFYIEGNKTLDEIMKFINEAYEDCKYNRIKIREI